MIKMPAIGHPHQYMQKFSVLLRKNSKSEDGMVIKSSEIESPQKIIDGILAKADNESLTRFVQNQNPITHTIVSYHPVVSVKKNDILILGERSFLVKGTEDPAGTGQFAIYYVLERNDTK